MAIEKKTPAVKPVPKPTIHNHYGADRHLLNMLFASLVAVLLYFAFTTFIWSSFVVESPTKEITHKVRIISGGIEKEVIVPREQPAPREFRN